MTVESLDYEVKDGKLETKALTKDGKIAVRAEKMDFLAADAEGKATGSISVNAKAVSVKSMDVDKEKLTDDKLAAGSSMTLVSEKMYVGAKSKDVKSKKLQAVSEEMGLFADKTFECPAGRRQGSTPTRWRQRQCGWQQDGRFWRHYHQRQDRDEGRPKGTEGRHRQCRGQVVVQVKQHQRRYRRTRCWRCWQAECETESRRCGVIIKY